MSKYLSTIGAVFLFWNLATSQFLSNTSIRQIEDELIFNQPFVLQNNIRAISGEYMIKKDWQGLTKHGNTFDCRFDLYGNLVYKRELELVANKWQTTEVVYLYNNEGQLIEEKTKRATGNWVKKYRYDQDKMVEVVNYLQGTEPDDQELIEINRQTFSWQTLNDSTFQKRIANNFGQPYLAITYFYDSGNDYLKRKEEYLLVTGDKKITHYEYNKMGWLQALRQGDISTSYLYDELGNVIEINHYRKEKRIKHVEYLYRSNGMLEAQLKTEKGSSAIHILKYQTEVNTN